FTLQFSRLGPISEQPRNASRSHVGFLVDMRYGRLDTASPLGTHNSFCVFTDGARPDREFLECLTHVDRIATSGSKSEIRKCTFDGIGSCSFADLERLLGDKLLFERATRNLFKNAHDFELTKRMWPAELEHSILRGGIRYRFHGEIRDVVQRDVANRVFAGAVNRCLGICKIEPERRAQPDFHETCRPQNGVSESALPEMIFDCLFRSQQRIVSMF